MKGLLYRALNSGELLEMIYLSNGNEISQRRLKVIRFNDDSLQAFCYKKGQVRTFKLTNILSVLPIPKLNVKGA